MHRPPTTAAPARPSRLERWFAPLLAAALGLAGLAGCSAPNPGQSGALRVGSDLANPPFAQVDAQGEPRGRDVEMMERLGAKLGREIEWVRMDFDALLDAVEAGEIDVVCATLGITPEREERIDFTAPYFETRISAVVRQGPGEPVALGDLAGRPVHAGLGTTSEFAVRERLPAALLTPAAKADTTTLERLLDGEIDAAVMDGPNADAMVAEHPTRLALLPTPLAVERYALAVRPDAPELLQALDLALADLQRGGLLTLLDADYGLR
jgi:ABC-type amino acid transport substrate-binding protein